MQRLSLLPLSLLTGATALVMGAAVVALVVEVGRRREGARLSCIIAEREYRLGLRQSSVTDVFEQAALEKETLRRVTAERLAARRNPPSVEPNEATEIVR